MGKINNQWVGLRENVNRKTPIYLMGKSMVSGEDFPLNQSIETKKKWGLLNME